MLLYLAARIIRMAGMGHKATKSEPAGFFRFGIGKLP
jgi:hypothetical protein